MVRSGRALLVRVWSSWALRRWNGIAERKRWESCQSYGPPYTAEFYAWAQVQQMQMQLVLLSCAVLCWSAAVGDLITSTVRYDSTTGPVITGRGTGPRSRGFTKVVSGLRKKSFRPQLTDGWMDVRGVGKATHTHSIIYTVFQCALHGGWVLTTPTCTYSISKEASTSRVSHIFGY